MVQYFATQIQTPLQTSLGAGKLRAQQDISALRQQQLQQAQQQQAQNQQLMGLRQQAFEGQPGAAGALYAQSPESLGPLQKYQEGQRQQLEQRGLDLARRVLNAPEEQRPQLYQSALLEAQQLGLTTSGFPLEYGPEADQAMRSFAGGPDIEALQKQVPENYSIDPITGQAQVIPGLPQSVLEEPTSLQKNLKAAGFVPGTPEYEKAIIQGVMKPQTQINLGDKSQEKRMELSEVARRKIIDKTFAAGEVAQNIGQNVTTIKNNLDSLVQSGGTTGPASGIVTFLNDLGTQFGLKLDLNETSSLTQIDGASNALAVPLVKQLGVNPTDKDFAIIKSTVARAGTSMSANYAFLYTLSQVAERQKQLSQIVQNAQTEGVGEIEMKRRMSAFNKQTHISSPVPLPKDKNKIKTGKVYTTDRGIYRFNGEAMEGVY